MVTGALHRNCLVAGAAAVVAATAGCSALLQGARLNDHAAGAPVTITQPAPRSLLVAVAGRGNVGQAVIETARPNEDLDVLASGPGGRTVASDSPPPAHVILPGKPASPGPGSSSYQWAQYRKAVSHWHSEWAADDHLVAAQTRVATMAWVHRLPLAGVTTGPPVSSARASLGAECALAVNAASGLVAQAGGQFGSRRVLLLSVTSLAGTLPAGSLNGDDVIVTTSFLPTSAAASAAQANLLAAGATRAAVLGTEVTAGQLDQLVTDGLSQQAVTETLSGRALFANNSATLLPSAVAVLTPLIAPLRRPGVTGIVNGYASTPGSARRNELLSQQRAAAVARFLETHGVPAARLLIVGHGASGWSGDNRRVVVVIEKPAPTSS